MSKLPTQYDLRSSKSLKLVAKGELCPGMPRQEGQRFDVCGLASAVHVAASLCIACSGANDDGDLAYKIPGRHHKSAR